MAARLSKSKSALLALHNNNNNNNDGGKGDENGGVRKAAPALAARRHKSNAHELLAHRPLTRLSLKRSRSQRLAVAGAEQPPQQQARRPLDRLHEHDAACQAHIERAHGEFAADGWPHASLFELCWSLDWSLGYEARVLAATGGVNASQHIAQHMRATLFDWLASVAAHVRVLPETLFSALALTDRATRRHSFALAHYQLVGVVCFWVACKVEERYVPELRDLLELTDNTFTATQARDMERQLLLIFDFRLNVPHVPFFARLAAALVKGPPHCDSWVHYACASALVRGGAAFASVAPSQLALGALDLVLRCYRHGVKMAADRWHEQPSGNNNNMEVDGEQCISLPVFGRVPRRRCSDDSADDGAAAVWRAFGTTGAAATATARKIAAVLLDCDAEHAAGCSKFFARHSAGQVSQGRRELAAHPVLRALAADAHDRVDRM